MKSVYCAVRTGSLIKAVCSSSLKVKAEVQNAINQFTEQTFTNNTAPTVFIAVFCIGMDKGNSTSQGQYQCHYFHLVYTDMNSSVCRGYLHICENIGF